MEGLLGFWGRHLRPALGRSCAREVSDRRNTKPETDLYVKARKAKDKAAMDKHREGRRAHEKAEAKRRELRKQRAALYPEAPKL